MTERFTVPCSGEEHEVEITPEDELVLSEHDREAEEIAAQLGAEPHGCMKLLEAWQEGGKALFEPPLGIDVILLRQRNEAQHRARRSDHIGIAQQTCVCQTSGCVCPCLLVPAQHSVVGPQRLQRHPPWVSKRQVVSDGETFLLPRDPLLEPALKECRKPQVVQSIRQSDALPHLTQKGNTLPQQSFPWLKLSYAQGDESQQSK